MIEKGKEKTVYVYRGSVPTARSAYHSTRGHGVQIGYYVMEEFFETDFLPTTNEEDAKSIAEDIVVESIISKVYRIVKEKDHASAHNYGECTPT